MAPLKKIEGTRLVRHMAARRCPTAATKVLVAIPVLRGESCRSLHLDGVIIQTDEDGYDQLLEANWYGIFIPFQWAGSSSVGTGGLETELALAISNQDGTSPWGGEPNPGGASAEWIDRQVMGQTTIFFRRETWLKPSIGVPDTAAVPVALNTQGRGVDTFKTTVHRRMDFDSDGILIVGVHRGTVLAQTDFGVAELDDSASLTEFMIALTQPSTAANANAQQLAELLYGGDTFIEADTLKDGNCVAYLKAIALIHTPYPANP